MKKAGPFKYRKVKALPSDSHPVNTRFYILTDRGNFWCPPFEYAWQTQPEVMTDCLEILNVFAVRVDLEIAARCHLDPGAADLDIGDNVAFRFNIPMLSWKQPVSAKGPKGDVKFRRSPGLHRPQVRILPGQDGKLAVSGLVRVARAANDKELGHSVPVIQRDSRPTGKTLPVRSSEDSYADAGD